VTPGEILFLSGNPPLHNSSMSTATDTPPAYKMPGVTLFASGIYRGQKWPASRVRAIAENCRKIGPSGLSLLVPPGVLGHEEEEDQDWLNRTGLPAALWIDPDSVKAVDDPDHAGEVLLVGDAVNIPSEVAERLKKREFTRCSAEFYEFIDDFGKSHGMTLRRLALLGGEVPQVKRLPPLPDPVPMAEVMKFSDQARVVRASQGTFILAFSERHLMDRAGMIAAVMAAMPGISQAWADGQSDEQLAELVKNLPAGGTATGDAAAATMADDMTREQMVAKITDGGADPASLEGKTDEELKAMLSGGTMGEGCKDTAKMSEAAQKSLARIREIEARAAAREKAAKVKDAAIFCESLVKEGRVTPAFVKAMDLPNVIASLDDTKPTVKFSEGGKDTLLSPFEAKKRELSRMPVIVKFGEQVDDGADMSDPARAKEKAVAKARQHAETVEEKQWGTTSFGSRRGFVQKFSEVYDKSPETAIKMLS